MENEDKNAAVFFVENLQGSTAGMEKPSYGAERVKYLEEKQMCHSPLPTSVLEFQCDAENVEKPTALVSSQGRQEEKDEPPMCVLPHVKQEETDEEDVIVIEDEVDVDDSLVVMRGEDFVVKLDPNYYDETNDESDSIDDLIEDSNSSVSDNVTEHFSSGEHFHNYHMPPLLAENRASSAFEDHTVVKTESDCDCCIQHRTALAEEQGVKTQVLAGHGPVKPSSPGHDDADLMGSPSEGDSQNSRPKLQCSTCGKNYSKRHGLKSHIGIVHQGAQVFDCPECRRKFQRRADLKVHCEAQHLQNVSQCPLCRKKYRYRRNMRLHFVKAHPYKDMLQCRDCQGTYQRLEELEAHACTSLRAMAHSCGECGYQFAQEVMLKLHVMIKHRGGKTEKKPR